MNKSTVIDVAKTMCNLFQNCLKDNVFPTGSIINIEVDRFSSEISVKRELVRGIGGVGRKQEILIQGSDSRSWKDFTEDENSILKARGDYYDPDER